MPPSPEAHKIIRRISGCREGKNAQKM